MNQLLAVKCWIDANKLLFVNLWLEENKLLFVNNSEFENLFDSEKTDVSVNASLLVNISDFEN